MDKPIPGHMPQNSQGKTMPVWFSSLLLAHTSTVHVIQGPSTKGRRGYSGFTASSPGVVWAPSRGRRGFF
ncbi:hypothetical protein E2I00_012856 [Balaenoptera physalus]|uniref:Uncharacterized protein n=1 Tax=Balaenoptera physalus TaxID=9770 RepID=A0A643BQB4_BALPH|nr:hypothetical protein E2I00_012856 [Balaenoptera physalus]